MTPSTTTYRRGDVVLVPFPFTDLTDIRQRPALIISADWFNDSHQDLALAAITSQIPATVSQAELMIPEADRIAAGLPRASMIRVGKVFAVHQMLVRRKLGLLSASVLSMFNEKLRLVLGLSIQTTPPVDNDADATE